ncbi:MAG TPA: amidohydrolase family protein, partial [Parvularculaceae bacterium]|nr:amidohydrolase family protein [Parvularculaceae bacterium]
FLPIFGALAGASLAGAAPAAAQTVLIQHAKVYTIGGAGVIDNGDVLINNGVIAAVGTGLSAPQGASVIDATGKVVTPGFFAPYSQIGIEEIGISADANDSRPDSGFPINASLDVVDAYNPTSTVIAITRAGGITRALTAPVPGGSLFGGEAAVIDLSSRIASVTKQKAAEIAVLGDAGSGLAGGNTRMGAWAVMREYLDAAIAYAANPRDYVQRKHDNDFKIADLEALGPVIAGREPLLVAVNSAADIRNLLRLKNDYRLNVIIIGGAEAWRVARELASANVPVILDPLDNLPAQFEDLGSTLANAARLNAAGVKIAFYNDDEFNERLLPQLAGNAVANGLPYDAALAALTINPATMFGLGQTLGSLEAGKAADVVIWDGDPLELSTRPVAVFIDGRQMSMENRQTKLRDRYKDLTRTDLPFAYKGGN